MLRRWMLLYAVLLIGCLLIVAANGWRLSIESNVPPRATPSVDTGCFSRVVGSVTTIWCDTGGETPNLFATPPPTAKP